MLGRRATNLDQLRPRTPTASYDIWAHRGANDIWWAPIGARLAKDYVRTMCNISQAKLGELNRIDPKAARGQNIY